MPKAALEQPDNGLKKDHLRAAKTGDTWRVGVLPVDSQPGLGESSDAITAEQAIKPEATKKIEAKRKALEIEIWAEAQQEVEREHGIAHDQFVFANERMIVQPTALEGLDPVDVDSIKEAVLENYRASLAKFQSGATDQAYIETLLQSRKALVKEREALQFLNEELSDAYAIHKSNALPRYQQLAREAAAEFAFSPEAAALFTDRYLVTNYLGAGGMGKVYLAEHLILDRKDAIKVFFQYRPIDEYQLEMFQKEMQALAKLNHPNVVKIHAGEIKDNQAFFAMEYVPGSNLEQLIGLEDIKLSQFFSIASQVLDGMEALHKKGLLHRDLKPANILVSPAGEVKILDLGLVTLGTVPEAKEELASTPSTAETVVLPSSFADDSHTAAGLVKGTPEYMAPEVVTGGKGDTPADIWAYGIVLAQILTGRSLFDARNALEIFQKVSKGVTDKEREMLQDLPQVLQDLILTILQKDPLSRPNAASIYKLLAAAEESLKNFGIDFTALLAKQVDSRAKTKTRVLPSEAEKEVRSSAETNDL